MSESTELQLVGYLPAESWAYNLIGKYQTAISNVFNKYLSVFGVL